MALDSTSQGGADISKATGMVLNSGKCHRWVDGGLRFDHLVVPQAHGDLDIREAAWSVIWPKSSINQQQKQLPACTNTEKGNVESTLSPRRLHDGARMQSAPCRGHTCLRAWV